MLDLIMKRKLTIEEAAKVARIKYSDAKREYEQHLKNKIQNDQKSARSTYYAVD